VHWQKQGLLVPAPPPLPWAASHAALPVADPNEDGRLRLYFSSRDARGRSHIGAAVVDLEAESGPEVSFAPEPVIAPGALGTFDDAGVTSACVVREGKRLFQYYSGWTLGVSVPFYFFVGCAVSDDDGRSFARISTGPVLERNNTDPYLTASPWVLIENGVWRMWYVSGTGWREERGRAKHWYHIKYAESEDGLVWRRPGTVCIDYATEEEYAIARPCVVNDGSIYRMWYSTRGASYTLGYAESADGIEWERKDAEAGLAASAGGWDSEMIAYPCVFDRADRRYLLYNGNGYGATGIGYATTARESFSR
jgi:hypothetical protein